MCTGSWEGPRARHKTEPPRERALGPEHPCLSSLRHVGKSRSGGSVGVGHKAHAELGPWVAAPSAAARMRARGRHLVTVSPGAGGGRSLLEVRPEEPVQLSKLTRKMCSNCRPNQWCSQTVGRRGRNLCESVQAHLYGQNGKNPNPRSRRVTKYTNGIISKT